MLMPIQFNANGPLTYRSRTAHGPITNHTNQGCSVAKLQCEHK